MPAESPPKTADLYVRSLAPQGLQSTQDVVIRRLDELKSGGQIDDYNIVVWGNRLPPESSVGQTTTGLRFHDTVKQFRQWATATGISLESFFPTETIRSEFTDEEYTCIRFPILTLAEYEDGTLQFVSPCSDEDTCYTIQDRLNALAADQEVLPTLSASEAKVADHEEQIQE